MEAVVLFETLVTPRQNKERHYKRTAIAAGLRAEHLKCSNLNEKEPG
jgi:hypothetical protein